MGDCHSSREEGHTGKCLARRQGEGRCGHQPLCGFRGEDWARASRPRTGGVAASVGAAMPGLLLLLWSLCLRRAGESGLEHRTPTEEGLGHGLRSDLHWKGAPPYPGQEGF